MGLFDYFRRDKTQAAGTSAPRAEVSAPGAVFTGLDDPLLLEFIRNGAFGETTGLKNMAVLRCVTLISNSLGMLPLNLIQNNSAKDHAKDHAAYRLLKRKPNDWQTPREFKALLTLRCLLTGNGYARVIRSGGRPIRLIPLTDSVTPKLGPGYQMTYEVTASGGAVQTLPASDVIHLRDISLDGIEGKSRIKLAGDVLALSSGAQKAAQRMFEKGVMAAGAIEVPNALSDNAYTRMRQSLQDNHSGAENTGSWMLLEEGAKANKWAATSRDAQQIENRNHQIEEVARLFGVPRPLLMMDDTSWGSGIEQLAIAFVQYTLAPWFNAWEEALARVMLNESELDALQFKFNERALLRGTLKDQAEFFAKALGAGGHAPWMTQNEVRELSDMPRSDDDNADKLRNPMTQRKDQNNEPDQTAGNQR